MTNPTIHNPDDRHLIAISRLAQETDRDVFQIHAHLDGKNVDGKLTIYIKEDSGDRLWSGYDWDGIQLTDDELQMILNCFEHS